MPEELLNKDNLEEIIKLTIDQGGSLRTKRSKDSIKLKFRTKKRLYTIKLPLREAESIIGDLEGKLTIE